MKLNENTVLIGTKVALVPYRAEHVPKYHEWMKSPYLQEMTASEPLSLDEEYEMQRSWHLDEDKLTFILTALPEDSKDSLDDMADVEIKDKAVMIGDVNIFLNDPDQDRTFGELELMIAESTYRRTGRGYEAIRIMMGYALEMLNFKTFHAKISLKNEPSINLFKSKFGFYEVSRSEIFQEVCLEWTIVDLPATPPVDNDGEELDFYGAKATVEDRKKIAQVYDDLIAYYRTAVRAGKYE